MYLWGPSSHTINLQDKAHRSSQRSLTTPLLQHWESLPDWGMSVSWLEGTKTILSQLSLPIPISTTGNPPDRQTGRELQKHHWSGWWGNQNCRAYCTWPQHSQHLARAGQAPLFSTSLWVLENTDASLPRAYLLQNFPCSGAPWCYVSLAATADMYLRATFSPWLQRKRNSML